jgi:predicted RND superfamily exporter protein
MMRALRAAALLATIPAAAGMARLYAGISSDMEELLPPDAPAVRALGVLRARLPGSQYLGVVVKGDGAGPFAAALAERVRAYPPDLVRLVRADIAEERRFVRDHAALYLDLADLREVRARVAAALARERRRANPFYVSLDDDDDDRDSPVLDLSDIEARRRDADPFAGRFPDDRLVSPDGRTALVLVFLATSDTGLARVGPLFERVRADVAALRARAAPGAPPPEVGYAGDAAISVEELAALQQDLTVSGVLVLALVAAAVAGFFRWWAAPLVLGAPLLVGIAWGFGLASLVVPHLGGSTAFLGSIVVGNGINPGILLLDRHASWRRAGLDVGAAVERAVASTWRPTLGAAVAATAGYAVLATCSFRGLAQFGVIGALGTLGCWAATYLLLPALLRRVDRGGMIHRKAGRREEDPGSGSGSRSKSFPPSRLPVHILRPRLVLATTAIAVAAAATLAIARLDRSFIEYDMTKLRRRDSAVRGEARWVREMDALLGRNFTGVALLAEREADLPPLLARLRGATRTGPLARVSSRMVAPDDVVPPDQPAKRAELRAIRALLTPAVRDTLAPADLARVDELLAAADRPPVTAAAVPELYARGLRERDGRMGRSALMLQSLDAATWDGALAIEAARALAGVTGAVTPPAHAAGGFVVSAAVLETLQREALPTTALAFAAVAALVVITFGRSRTRHAALVLAALVASVTLLAGAAVALGQRLNFLSFVAFPITFGIGVEYPINVLARRRALPGHGPRADLAVGLCSLTTIIGYGSLLLAENNALRSFGVLAVLGELCCITVALVALPAALALRAPRAAP